jgi:hypothetical protein
MGSKAAQAPTPSVRVEGAEDRRQLKGGARPTCRSSRKRLSPHPLNGALTVLRRRQSSSPFHETVTNHPVEWPFIHQRSCRK